MSSIDVDVARRSGDVEDSRATPLLTERQDSSISETTTCCFASARSSPQTLQQFLSVACFISLGAGQALAAKISMDDQGSLPYDTSAAVFWAEVVKLMASLVWIAVVDRDRLRWPVPQPWLMQSWNLFIVAVLFAMTNELNYLVVEYLGPALFMILGNLKIVFTCLFMRLMLGKLFSAPQWAGVVLLTISAAVVKLPELEQQTSVPPVLATGFMTLLGSTMCSGLASVTNERILKKEVGEGNNKMPFMVKNIALYTWGVALNFFAWCVYGKYGIAEGFNAAAVVSILCLAGLGMACSVILCYLDNVARCFSCVAQVLFTVAASRLLLPISKKDSFGWFYVLSLVLLAAALVIYQAYQSPRFPGYAAAAMLGALLVGLACMELDRWQEGAI